MSDASYQPNRGIKSNFDSLKARYMERLKDLLGQYDAEFSELWSEGLTASAESLRRRNESIPSVRMGCELTPELEKEGKEAAEFITEYESSSQNTMIGKPRLAQALEESYRKALETRKNYQEALAYKARMDELASRADAGVFIKVTEDGLLIYPSIYFEDAERNPSLMLNLLEYCLAVSESAGFETSIPDKEGRLLKIKVKDPYLRPEQATTKLKHALCRAKPSGFDEANLELFFIVGTEYEINLKERHAEPALEAEGVAAGMDEYTQAEAMRMLGLNPNLRRPGGSSIFWWAKSEALREGKDVSPHDGYKQTSSGPRKAKFYKLDQIATISDYLITSKRSLPSEAFKILESFRQSISSHTGMRYPVPPEPHGEMDEKAVGSGEGFEKRLAEPEEEGRYSVAEAAKALGVSENLIYYYQKRHPKRLPKRIMDKRLYLSEEDMATLRSIRGKKSRSGSETCIETADLESLGETYELDEAASKLFEIENALLNGSSKMSKEDCRHRLESYSARGFISIYPRGSDRYLQKTEFDNFLAVESAKLRIARILRSGRKVVTSSETEEILGAKSDFIKRLIKSETLMKDDSGHIILSSIKKYIKTRPALVPDSVGDKDDNEEAG